MWKADIAGPAEGKQVLVPRRVLKVGGRNRVRFDIEGRGTFGYAVTLAGFARDFGPDQSKEGRRFMVQEHRFEPASPEVNGKALPVGFASVVNPTLFVNRATQVAGGGRVHVVLLTGLRADEGRGADYLVLEEPFANRGGARRGVAGDGGRPSRPRRRRADPLLRPRPRARHDRI